MRERLATMLIGTLAVALVAVALGLAAERRGTDAAGAGTATKPKLTTNKRGEPIIRFARIAPGDVRQRRVRVSNRGAPGKLRLSAVRLRSPAGPRRGVLADALRIEVRRIRGARTKRMGTLGRRVYRGPLAEMGTARLGRIGRLRARNYQFKLRFPEGGAPPSAFGGDNAFQGARARVKFRWRAR